MPVTAAVALASDDGNSVPVKAWRELQQRIGQTWDIVNNAHIGILAQTGGGKSYLIKEGLLPLIQYDHMVVIDVKGDDPTLAGIGKPVKEIPRHEFDMKRLWNGKTRQKEARSGWYRLIVPENVNQARNVVENTLRRCYSEGNWIIVFDEARHLTDRRSPFLNLAPMCENIWVKGRSRRVSIVAASQAPKWLPSSFYEQSSQVFIGRIRDEDTQKRLREISGMDKAKLPVIANLKPRQFLYVGPDADLGEYFAITQVTKGGKINGNGIKSRDGNRRMDSDGSGNNVRWKVSD